MKYASTDVLILNRARVIKQIERQIKEWLTEQMEKDGNFYFPQSKNFLIKIFRRIFLIKLNIIYLNT
jgi:hypothetical protein